MLLIKLNLLGNVMMSNPYDNLPDNAFWRKAVAEKHPLNIESIYKKKFNINNKHKIASAGSCFAQHIGRKLREHSFNYMDYEPAPKILAQQLRAGFGYEMYSARYGNIYTARQLIQLFERAFDEFTPKEDYWENDGAFFDPFRPTIEKGGYASLDELHICRRSHLKKVRQLFLDMDVFIFTLGLTEAWISKEDGAVFPLCPGTVAGSFDADKYEFHNFTYSEIVKDMLKFMNKLNQVNKGVKLILTVSPVPLTATATGNHVLTATTYSKSVLRAVAGELYQNHPRVDYYPSYELVTGAPMRSMFFEPNMRSVVPKGVEHVLSYFLQEHLPEKQQQTDQRDPESQQDEDVICDEVLLEAGLL
ncbi:GSCFA domain-containing protein [Amphritea pacifica]|uniref:GSCFA domain-containing protein n=1 Tax=Amphritea pacifica TaxID=2811233 RepID=UPI001966884B|nr:GSCFA domain-containing protein [Amphritea pacifica]MBN1007492.1 GSCFA domain-containing protein [Amphritea pacifica]